MERRKRKEGRNEGERVEGKGGWIGRLDRDEEGKDR